MTTRTSIHDVRRVVSEDNTSFSETIGEIHKWTTVSYYNSKGEKIYELVIHHSDEGVKYESGS